MENAIFRRGRPTNFTLGTGMEPVSPTCWVTPKATGQGNVMSSVRCTIAYNSTTKSHRNTKTDRKVSRSTPHIRHQFQGQMVKGLGHQAAMTENQPCFRKREGLRASKLVYGWSSKTRIEVRDDPKLEVLGGCSIHHLQGRGHIVAAALQVARLVKDRLGLTLLALWIGCCLKISRKLDDLGDFS